MPVNLEANAPADCGITLQEMQGKKKVTSHCTFCTYIYTKTVILIKLKKKITHTSEEAARLRHARQ